MFAQINTLITAYLSVNQEQFIERAKIDGHGNDFVRVLIGDDQSPQSIETEKIYTVDEVLVDTDSIVVSTDSIEAEQLRLADLYESPGFWPEESKFQYM